MGKDEVLPLASHSFATEYIAQAMLNPVYNAGFHIGQDTQQNADWERVKALVEALQQISDMGRMSGDQYVAKWGIAVAASFPARIADKALAQLKVEVKK